MAIQYFQYCAKSRLACAGCPPAQVILCINPPSLVASKDVCCGVPSGVTPFNYSTIEATVTSVTETYGSCGKEWIYSIEYDDSQVIEGRIIHGTNVKGIFCEGCFTTWIRELVGNEVCVQDDTPTQGYVTITTQHGCSYTFKRGWSTVDGDEEGFTVTYPDGETNRFEWPTLSVVDTATVDLTLTGGKDKVLQADVRVSNTPGNALVVDGSGLYVAPVIQTPITPIDTSTVDLAVTGVNAHTVQADVKISTTPGNSLTVNATGLFVPSPSAGVTSLNLGSGCEAGQGAEQMIRDASIAGGVLTLRSAPEHDFRVGAAPGSATLNYSDVRAVDTYPGPSLDYLLSAGSCRGISYVRNLTGFVQVRLEGGGKWEIAIQEWSFTTSTWSDIFKKGGATGGGVGAWFDQTLDIYALVAGSLAAGASELRRFRMVYRTIDMFNAGINSASNVGLGSGILMVGSHKGTT